MSNNYFGKASYFSDHAFFQHAFYLTALGSKELNISLALGGFLSLIHPFSLPPPPPQLFKQHMEKTEQMSFMLLTKCNAALLLEIIVRFKII